MKTDPLQNVRVKPSNLGHGCYNHSTMLSWKLCLWKNVRIDGKELWSEKNRWEKLGRLRWGAAKSQPVYNNCLWFQSGTHVYSFWHQGPEADRSMFTERAQISQWHDNKQHHHHPKRHPTCTPEISCSNNQFASISIKILSQCL